MQTLKVLGHLVGYDTTSCNSNIQLMDFIGNYLDENGIHYRRVTTPDGKKSAIHAKVGNGPGGMAFSGHVDTVPVTGQSWSSDPFTLRRDDGRLYGRGTVDMKGFVSSALAMLPRIKDSNLATPVHLLISYDEETDVSGANHLALGMTDDNWRPEMCIVGEPTMLQPVIAHKAKLVITAKFRGSPGHSSLPERGVNAIYPTCRTIGHIEDMAHGYRFGTQFDMDFEPPYSTAHVGVMRGGSVLNIIPESASFMAEWRTLPVHDARHEFGLLQSWVEENVIPRMTANSLDAGVEFETYAWLPPLELDPKHELVGLVQLASGHKDVKKVSYATEAGIFQAQGIATIVCGPGNIEQAHRPDEWISEDQLHACDRFILDVVEYYNDRAVGRRARRGTAVQ